MNKITLIILIILTIGVVYKLALISGGNFFFNMDNGRDMVDVREMVILGKLRLTGPTSAIEGLYNGPAWYYLLAAPFILSGGDPYASIVMEIIFWAVGGFFLMKLVSRWGVWLMIPIGSVWIASDYITLANRYAFNPNPVTLLCPLFIYLLLKYVDSGKMLFSTITFLLAGLFFNFEMNAGIFLPVVIIVSLILSGKGRLIKDKSFWVGLVFFLLTLLPQVIFDLKHNFIMSKSVINFLLNGNYPGINLFTRLESIALTFYQVFLPMMMHNKLLTWGILGLIVITFLKWESLLKKNILIIICFSMILVPFLGYLLFPVNVNLWHLGPEAVAFLILIGFVIKMVWDKNIPGKIIGFGLAFSITWFSLSNIFFVCSSEIGKPSGDPSIFKNEVSVIDYVYKYAKGENFKVYTYLPSVYDYPYQYLIWWYGLKNYGYLPVDYAYAPNEPSYIFNKASFSLTEDQIKERTNSGLVFLIKEPDRNYTRPGWEGDFVKLTSIEKQMVGPIEVEVRKEL